MASAELWERPLPGKKQRARRTGVPAVRWVGRVARVLVDGREVGRVQVCGRLHAFAGRLAADFAEGGQLVRLYRDDFRATVAEVLRRADRR